MSQKYLEITRQFTAGSLALANLQTSPPGSDNLGGAERQPNQPQVKPIPILNYRNGDTVRRCLRCRHILSVVAVRDICGRCATPRLESSVHTEPYSQQAILRGKLLVALERQRYPKATLSDGRRVGRGVLNWAPVLREIGEAKLRELLDQIANLTPPPETEVDAE